MSPAFDALGVSCAGQHRTYYDSPHALYQRFLRYGDAARYRLLGVRAVGENGRPAAAIATRIDGAAATLLVGRERDVEGIPAWGWLGKQLLVRRDPVSGVHRMSWRNAGKAYTLVTDPGVSPELACQLCHVDARRRKAIARVAEQL